MPVVSQSIMKPIVPVGAMTVVCALRIAADLALLVGHDSSDSSAASNSAGGTRRLSMLLTASRCMRITSRNGCSLRR